MHHDYALEQLYADQDPDLVHDAVAALISWLDPDDKSDKHAFTLRMHQPAGDVDNQLIVSWDIQKLTACDPGLPDDLRRFRKGKTLHLEDQTKCAAYGLAFVAISCILQRRVVAVSLWRPPDLLLDETPGSLCGVEVAGRGSNGYAAFKQALDGNAKTKKTLAKPGKRAQLRARTDVIEAYISLWCRKPMVSIWEQVKP